MFYYDELCAELSATIFNIPWLLGVNFFHIYSTVANSFLSTNKLSADEAFDT